MNKIPLYKSPPITIYASLYNKYYIYAGRIPKQIYSFTYSLEHINAFNRS